MTVDKRGAAVGKRGGGRRQERGAAAVAAVGDKRGREPTTNEQSNAYRSVFQVLVGPIGQPDVENVGARLGHNADDHQYNGKAPTAGPVLEVNAENLSRGFDKKNRRESRGVGGGRGGGAGQ